MYKVIELEIDPSLSADTGVFEVAWVESPAIEQELMYFAEQKFFVAPEYVQTKACQAIKENEKRGNPAGTQVGKVRAQQLCQGENLSLETIKRMKSFLSRAATYDTGNWDDNGTIAMGLWGGKEALTWVDKIISQEEEMGIQDFVNPNAGEDKDTFIARCVSVVRNEGKTEDQALGQCYGMWENRQFSGAKVSFEWKNTLDTPRGIRAFENELSRGSRIYIISDLPRMTDDLVDFSLKYRIPSWRIFTEGNIIEKVDKIKELGIQRHYDSDPRIRFMLGDVGMRFDYVLDLPVYVNYPASGDTGAMLVEPLLTEDFGCGCSNDFGIQDFSLDIFGYKTKHFDMCPGAVALFEHLKTMTSDEETIGMIRSAAQIADNVFEIEKNVVSMGANDSSLLDQAIILVDDFKDLMREIDEEVGMVHDVSFMDGHIEIIREYLNEWTTEEVELSKHFDFMIQNQTREEFEAITSPLLRGFTEGDVKKQKHKNATTYYQYARKAIPAQEIHRDFCMSLENRFLRISQIYALEGANRAFGHNGSGYSKWLYKGGPQCIHAWRKYTALQNQLNDEGFVQGKPGTAPHEMMGKGYYPGTPRYQANLSRTYMNEQQFGQCFNGVCDVKFSEQKTQVFAADQDQRMIYTPLMIPNILIPRFDEVSKEKYFVKFSPDSIRQIRDKFMIQLRGRMTNYEHSDKKFEDVVMVESWIVEGDNDKAYQIGFTKDQIPDGTWMGAYKVLDTPEGDTVWNEYIKPGKVKGASVEGNFILNFSQQSEDDYLLSSIINILNNIDE